MNEALILASGLKKAFGETRAVDGVDLRVGAGEIYGLVGPDGAGKTTLIRLLCGALHRDAGEVSLAGFDVVRQTERAREQIGYLAQRFSMYEELTVLENLRFFAEVRGLPSVDWLPRSHEILSFVGLADFGSRRAGQLSGGMKQKLGLAAALINRPKILLLDEPTTGVDPVTRQDFWQLIIRLVAQTGMTVLVSTPYMDEAARCMRLGFMRRGQILIEGTPKELRKRLEGQVIELAGRPLPLLLSTAQTDDQVENAQMFGGRLHLRVKKGKVESLLPRLRERIEAVGGTIERFGVIDAQLEDVFISLLDDE